MFQINKLLENILVFLYYNEFMTSFAKKTQISINFLIMILDILNMWRGDFRNKALRAVPLQPISKIL